MTPLFPSAAATLVARKPSRWPGQAIVMFVLALVGLLGLAGLAIDGGRLAMEKRRAQAAADAAAMAGGLTIAYAPMQDDGTVSSAVLQEAIAKARARAAENGYDNDGAQDTVTVTIEGPLRDKTQWVYLVNVDITAGIPPALIQLVYNGPLRVSTHAQSRARPYQALANGFTLLTTGDDDPGLRVGGNGLVDIEGNLWVNTGTVLNGALTLRADTLYSVGPVDIVGNPNLQVDIQGDLGTRLNMPALPEPACPGPNRGNITGSGTYQPGTYGQIRIQGSATVTFEPGLYCVEGDFTLNGGDVTGDGVMFFVRNGQVKLAGNGQVHLTAATNLRDANGHQWGGMLFYMPPDNHQGFDLQGTADFFLDGTVYVAGDATPQACHIAGTSGTLSLQAQFICYSAKVMGTADVVLRYPSTVYHAPPVLDLTE